MDMTITALGNMRSIQNLHPNLATTIQLNDGTTPSHMAMNQGFVQHEHNQYK